MMPSSLAARTHRTFLAACLAALLSVGLMAFGATAVAQQSQQSQQPAQTDFERATLESFAAAAVQVREIQQEYSQRLDNASEREEASALQEEANKEMLQAIQSNGMDVQTYNAVARATRQDQDVRATVNQLMEQLSGASSSS